MFKFGRKDRERRIISEFKNALDGAFSYIGTNYSPQSYRYRNYTADSQIYKTYLNSSLVAAVISCYEMSASEAPIGVYYEDGAPYKSMLLSELLRSPNQWMNEGDLTKRTFKDMLLTGNSYWIKQRKNGIIRSLFPINDMNMSPVGTPENFIDHYKYTRFDGGTEEFAPEDVIHIPFIYTNPIYPNKGISPSALCADDVDADTSFSQFISAFLQNYAHAGTVFKVSDEVFKNAVAADISQETLDELKSLYREKFTGQKRGDVAVLPPGFSIETQENPLKDLDLTASRATPEARVCAVFRIPPQVANLNIGLGSSTQNNLAESRIRWTNTVLIPLWIHVARHLSRGLASDFEGVVLKYDTSKVEAVKEQRLAQAAQMSASLQSLVEKSGGDSDAYRAIAEYAFGVPDEYIERMFAATSLSNLSATEKGKIINVNQTSRRNAN